MLRNGIVTLMIDDGVTLQMLGGVIQQFECSHIVTLTSPVIHRASMWEVELQHWSKLPLKTTITEPISAAIHVPYSNPTLLKQYIGDYTPPSRHNVICICQPTHLHLVDTISDTSATDP